MGYLPGARQEARGPCEAALKDLFAGCWSLRKNRALEQEIASGPSGAGDLDSLLARYGGFARRFEDEGYLIESRISTVAAGLGFSRKS